MSGQSGEYDVPFAWDLAFERRQFCHGLRHMHFAREQYEQ